jgi:hypothetical protein
METREVLRKLADAVYIRKENADWPYCLFLTRGLSECGPREGYWALARLMCRGYFSTVLTSNQDTELEEALRELGWYTPQCKVLTVGQDADEQIAEVLEESFSGIHIVKLYSDRSQTGQTVLPLILSSDIQTSLQRYFNRHIVIVGCIEQEESAISALHAHEKEGIYYVRQNSPTSDDIVVKCVEKLGKQPEDFLITGAYGEFNTFFRTLEGCIKERRAGPQLGPDTSQRVRISAPDPSDRHGRFQSEDVHRPRSPRYPPYAHPINVLYVYASADEELRRQIEAHLSPLHKSRLICEWDHGKLLAGTEREVETRRRWEEAQVILLLISSDFIASSNYGTLVKRAMERYDAGTARVVPIILRPVDWRGEAFAKLQVLPDKDDHRPITIWSDRDEALLNVVQGIRRVVGQLVVSGDGM